MGTTLSATQGTRGLLRANRIELTILHWPLEGKSPNVVEYLSEGKIALVINILKHYQEPELTNIQQAERFVEALSRKSLNDLQAEDWAKYTT